MTTSLEWVARALEVVGVAILVAGAFYTVVQGINDRRQGRGDIYFNLRRRFGRSLLLSLEVLVAADIVQTVVVDLTLQRILTLGVLVLIRTILSISLAAEIEGELPWRRNR